MDRKNRNMVRVGWIKIDEKIDGWMDRKKHMNKLMDRKQMKNR